MRANFIAKRVRFRNGERHSVLMSPSGLPVHEATLYLNRYRRKGRAANTIQFVCASLALLYRELSDAKIDLLQRLREGRFLSLPEVARLAEAAQFWVDEFFPETAAEFVASPRVVNIKRIRMPRKVAVKERRVVDVGIRASRLRYMADYFDFIVGYFAATLSAASRSNLLAESTPALLAFRAEIPSVSRRAQLGAREGLSKEDQDRILDVIVPSSRKNPWKREFVRRRNWLIVVLMLATGIRKSELLGLKIGDLHSSLPKLRIMRRADDPEDSRFVEANTKTNDRELELTPAIMSQVWQYINRDRHAIKAARKHPFLFVAEDGGLLSSQSIDKLFVLLRGACPGLPVRLTSHVLRHTWNERFTEQADLMGLLEVEEERARNEQQGWAADSKTASVYTRRHTSRKGRELSLKLQEKLDVTS